MSFTLVLGVVIGLASLFFALSLVATWLQELVAAALKWRSRTLAAAIRAALEPSAKKSAATRELQAAWSAEAGASVRRRLEESLFKALYRHPLVWAERGASDLPTYIPTRQLAAALLDLLSRAGGEDSPVRDAFRRIEAGVRSVGDARARTVLKSMVRAAEMAGGDVELRVARVRDAVAGWADAMMARASGWYRRRAQIVAFALGLALALAFNVDTVRVARSLWHDALLAEAVRVQVERGSASAIDRLAEIGLPIGWRPGGFPSDAGALALWMLGILLTGIAVAQGSPFWFDALKRFTNVRLTEERSDDA